MVALIRGKIHIAQANMLGAILSNLLLVRVSMYVKEHGAHLVSGPRMLHYFRGLSTSLLFRTHRHGFSVG
jgi:hypothetical protein